MRRCNCLFVVLFIAVLLPGTVLAKDKNPNSSNGADRGRSVSRVRLDLDPVLGSATSARYDRQTRTRGGVVSKDDFQLKLKVPLPSTLPLLATSAEAKLADVRLVFLRSGVEYAQCYLKANGSGRKAQYRLLIKLLPRRATVRDYKGTCDLDLAVDGVQNGLPATEAGDEVILRHYVGGVGTDFMTGLLP